MTTGTRSDSPGWGFLTPRPPDVGAEALLDRNRDNLGFVMNLTRAWSQLPDAMDGYERLVGLAARAAGLSPRERALLISACASSREDAYCSLVWGTKLADFIGPHGSAAVLAGDDTRLEADDRALTRWARLVSTRPNDTTADDVDLLRAAARTDRQIFALTVFLALRAAFASVNDALGVLPDAAVAATAPRPVREAVSFGRDAAPAGPICA